MDSSNVKKEHHEKDFPKKKINYSVFFFPIQIRKISLPTYFNVIMTLILGWDLRKFMIPPCPF
jgi:hypothetical protein